MYKSHDKAALANDISQAINFDVIGDKLYVEQSDSLGQAFNSLIKPAKILDYNGKRAIVNQCLAYYESKKLDSIAKHAYKKYLKARAK